MASKWLTLAVIMVVLGSGGEARADAGECSESGFPAEVSYTVARATSCVEGANACCAGLLWIPGWGPASAEDIPVDLSGRLVPVLAARCAAGSGEACTTWPAMLLRLGRRNEALGVHQRLCAEYSGRACLAAAELLLDHAPLPEATRLAQRGCDRGNEEACLLAGKLWKRLAEQGKALAAFRRGCEFEDHACCGEARLLTLGDRRGSWDVVRGDAQNLLVVEDLGAGRIRMVMHTSWANGHTCSYGGEGTVEADRAVMDAEEPFPECRPVLVRKEGAFILLDPGDHCRSNSCGTRGMFEYRW